MKSPFNVSQKTILNEYEEGRYAGLIEQGLSAIDTIEDVLLVFMLNQLSDDRLQPLDAALMATHRLTQAISNDPLNPA